MAKYCIIFFLLYILSISATAQYDNPSINSPKEQSPTGQAGQSIKFERLASYEGLSNKLISCIIQDNKGFMWFGTSYGLYKYDGYKFTGHFHDSSNENSLSNNRIHSLYKDRAGNIWIGTNGSGLNKFDPKTEKFIHYLSEIDNPNSLVNNYILQNGIYEDHNGDLWIGTQKGLSRIIFPNSDSTMTGVTFINYKHNPNDANSLSNNYIGAIYEDVDFNIWIGTVDGMLHKFNRKNEKIDRIVTAKRLKEKLEPIWGQRSVGQIKFIGHHPDDLKNILTITSDGYIYKYDYNSNKIISQYNELADIIKESKLTYFNDILFDQNRSTWIATNNGCYIISNNDNQIYHYYWKRNDPTSLSWRHVRDIYKDRQGIIWFGLVGNPGINKYDPKTQNYKTHNIETNTTHYSIFSLFEESTNKSSVLWLGTGKNGLLKFNRDSGKLRHYKGDIKYPISSICQSPDNKNNLWLGTVGGGLYKFDIKAGSLSNNIYHSPIENLENDPHNKNLVSTTLIISMLFDTDGQLWLGSVRGLYKYDIVQNQYTSYLHDPDDSGSISANDISAISESHYNSDSILWIGTRTGGLNKLNKKSGKFTNFKHDPDNTSSINANYISSILEDESGTLWIGTPKGLNRYNRSDNTFTHIMDKEKKLNAEIMSIIEDKSGYLWMNTMGGLLKFNPENGKLISYKRRFARWAYYQNKSGDVFYAVGSDILTFNPNKIKEISLIPPVVLTDFQIFNESIKVNQTETSHLQKSISETNKITLSHEESVFSFEFAVLDYSNPLQNKYAYKMEIVDPDWVHTDASRRFATYTNLDPGEYTFRVKGSNNDGIWNEDGTSINIVITPPWWKTNLAYTFYFLLFCTILIGTWRAQLRRIRLRQQLNMEHFEAEKLREVDKLKTRFFANISHEFRTPLTLIKGPVKQIMDGEFTGNLKQQCKMILRNSDRLLGLINQILDLSKLESGEIKLQVAETDIIKYFKGMVLSFSSLAETKKVILKFTASENSLMGFIDRDKLEKIVTNLLSNAFKFTPEGGMVEVKLSLRGASQQTGDVAIPKKIASLHTSARNDTKGQVQITISNTGPGIPANQIDKIFDRFYQSNNNYKKDSEGSGIGLALTKELVEVCYGKISVSSIPNETTTFYVILPIDIECFKEDEIVQIPVAEIDSPLKKGARGLLKNDDEFTEIEGRKPKPKTEKSAPLLLIVEDNPDVTEYICTFMENDYRILTAENGNEGLKKVIDKYPDLVISDVMMPEMDGFELCQSIKTDERISHIPVILLTAKVDLDSKINGLEFGADDYINKPFEARELQVRSKNLIEQRKKLRERFSALIDLKPEDISASSMDEQFLQRLLTVFEDHIEEAKFKTTELAHEVGLSRMHLNRKIQSLTNLSTNDFIRTLRLQRAAQLLRNASGTISEIAYKVGFNNLSHFSKSFRRHFGILPSEYSKNEK